MLAKDLFPYEKHKDKFLKNSNRSRRGFKEALVEIIENPKVKWGLRGQDEDEDEDDDEDEDEDDSAKEDHKSAGDEESDKESSDDEVTKPVKQVHRVQNKQNGSKSEIYNINNYYQRRGSYLSQGYTQDMGFVL